MMPLKWGWRRVWGGQGVYRVIRGWYGQKGRHPHMGLYLPIEVAHAPINLYSIHIRGCPCGGG